MMGSVIALAGRRVDADEAPARRFPLANAPVVGERIKALLVRHHAQAIVSSAACGADLLALEAAGALGLRRVVVLPFPADRFRVESVTDRPGGEARWGKSFDRVLSEVPAADVVVLEGAGDGTEAFTKANEAIIDNAVRLAKDLDAEAAGVIVWDGAPRGDDDLTARFAARARDRGIVVEELSTL
jgi:hypothetical protein